MCVHACMLFLFVMGTVEFGAFFLQESDFSPSVRTGYKLEARQRHFQPRKKPKQDSWCGLRVAKVQNGHENKYLPKFILSPSRRGWWG